jgi:hypothetical protein
VTCKNNSAAFQILIVESSNRFSLVHFHFLKINFHKYIRLRMIKSRKMRWAGHVARMVARRNAYRLLVGKPEGRRPLGKPRRRWVDNIKMDFRQIGWDGLD